VSRNAPDPTPWYFYQANNAASNNFEIKRTGMPMFNWSPYQMATDLQSFVAYNHAKRLPNNTTPTGPHAWFLENGPGGSFKLKWQQGTYLTEVPEALSPTVSGPKVITKPFVEGNRKQLWNIYTDVPMYNPTEKIAFNQNPFGPWEIGYGTVGGDFTRMTKFERRGTGGYWNGNESWKGLYFNPGATDMVMSGGFVVKTGMLVMHPGNGNDHLSILRFTVPQDGSYEVNVKWTAIDDAAKKSWVWVYSNGQSVTGTIQPIARVPFKELFTKGIVGFGGTASYQGTLQLKQGEVIDFEVGNGGDGYSDDALEINLVITKK
jgi:hypothetical protein